MVRSVFDSWGGAWKNMIMYKYRLKNILMEVKQNYVGRQFYPVSMIFVGTEKNPLSFQGRGRLPASAYPPPGNPDEANARKD